MQLASENMQTEYDNVQERDTGNANELETKELENKIERLEERIKQDNVHELELGMQMNSKTRNSNKKSSDLKKGTSKL